MKRLEALDSLRGIAALLVVIYHYSTRYYQIYSQSNHINFTLEFGKLGVNMFFVISGFVIFMSLLKVEKPLDFIVTRFIRLYPIFWIAVIFTFLATHVFTLENRSVEFKDMIVNLTMIPSIFNTPYVDGVYWTLLYELKFYILIFTIYLLGFLNRINLLSILALFIIILFRLTNFESFFIFKILNFILIFEYLPYFISGIMFFKIYENIHNKFTIIILIISFIINLFNSELDTLWFIILLYILFTLLSFHKLNWIANNFLVYLGTISYSLYLIHQNIGYIILNYLFSENVHPLYSFLLAILISILISSILTYFIEKPIIKYLRDYYKNKEKVIKIFFHKFKLTKSLVKIKNVK
ncbi:MAG: acyltransferase [Aliarcobacter sp.]|jgi:peptidoglycan/LPS O-acetylase OafA/YrhL|nr:acyltransferase [Aliarcobacter sp.]